MRLPGPISPLNCRGAIHRARYSVWMCGFTMIELLTVVIIISIMAAFGIPSFSKAIRRARARDAINNLTILHATQALYRARNGNYLAGNTLAQLNTGLGLTLIANAATYACNDAAPPTTCVATSSAGAADFQVSLVLANPVAVGTNPSCTPVAGCP